MLRIAVWFVFICGTLTVRAQDRLWIAAQVNGKPATFIFDTGCSEPILFTTGAARLGLLNSNDIQKRVESDFAIGTNQLRVRFTVIIPPERTNSVSDGLLGWRFWSSNILQLDAESGQITPLAAVPTEAGSWVKIPILANTKTLSWIITNRGTPEEYIVDTGDGSGVELSPRNWKIWRKHHRSNPSAPIVFASYWNRGVSADLAVEELAWADALDVGPLHLTGIPVNNSGPMSGNALTDFYYGTVGIAVLKRMDLIIDGPHSMSYARPKTTPPPPFDHNRSGMVILPPEHRTDNVVLHVMEGGPAYEAGFRTGDIVLEYNGRVVKVWEDIPWGVKPAIPGEKRTIKVKRGSEIFTSTLTCRDIIGPPYDPTRKTSPVTNDFSHYELHLNPE